MGDTTINISFNKSNAGALILDTNFPPQLIPRSKYYATKTIWFCGEIFKRRINLLKIDNVDHLGDLFTKGLTITTFECLIKKIMSS